MEDISPELLAKAKELLHERTVGWKAGICQGACIGLDGRTIVNGHGACHSWVNTAYRLQCGSTWSTTYNKLSKPFLTLSCHTKKRSKCSDEASDAIILWMAKESPFSQFVLNKDDDESLTTDGIILLCGPGGLTPAQALWVCKVLRYTTENGKSLDTWLMLTKGGVNPMLALVVASCVTDVKGATFGYTGPNHHTAVFCSYGANYVDTDSVLNNRINPEAEETYGVFQSPLFEPKKGDKYTTTVIQSFCNKAVMKDDGWGGQVKASASSDNALLQNVLAWQQQQLGEQQPIPPKLPDSSTVYLDLDM